MSHCDSVFITDLWEEQLRGERTGTCSLSPRELKRLLVLANRAVEDLPTEIEELRSDKQILEENITTLLKDDPDVIRDRSESGAKSLAISLSLTMARTRHQRDSYKDDYVKLHARCSAT